MIKEKFGFKAYLKYAFPQEPARCPQACILKSIKGEVSGQLARTV